MGSALHRCSPRETQAAGATESSAFPMVCPRFLKSMGVGEESRARPIIDVPAPYTAPRWESRSGWWPEFRLRAERCAKTQPRLSIALRIMSACTRLPSRGLTGGLLAGSVTGSRADWLSVWQPASAVRGFSCREVDHRAGLTDGYFSRLVCGDIEEPTARTIAAINRALGIEVEVRIVGL
jgi:hypothetical protein